MANNRVHDNFEIYSLADYYYITGAAQEYKESVVRAILKLTGKNPKDYPVDTLFINYNDTFVALWQPNPIVATTRKALELYLEGSTGLAEIEHAKHAKEIAAYLERK